MTGSSRSGSSRGVRGRSVSSQGSSYKVHVRRSSWFVPGRCGTDTGVSKKPILGALSFDSVGVSPVSPFIFLVGAALRYSISCHEVALDLSSSSVRIDSGNNIGGDGSMVASCEGWCSGGVAVGQHSIIISSSSSNAIAKWMCRQCFAYSVCLLWASASIFQHSRVRTSRVGMGLVDDRCVDWDSVVFKNVVVAHLRKPETHTDAFDWRMIVASALENPFLSAQQRELLMHLDDGGWSMLCDLAKYQRVRPEVLLTRSLITPVPQPPGFQR